MGNARWSTGRGQFAGKCRLAARRRNRYTPGAGPFWAHPARMKTVTVKVPGSTSNLGPGFDCLGVALAVYNRVTVTNHPPPANAGVEASEMATEAAHLFFASSKHEPFAFGCRVAGDVPMSRGLGSSVTLRLGLLTGLNVLCGSPLTRQTLFELCAELEGHPDNAAPAQFGGFTVAAAEGGASALRFAVSARLRFVLLIPDFEVRTEEARRLLPLEIPRRAAVASSARACRITAAFAARRYDALRGAFADTAFHEPHRLPLIPFLPDVVSAACNAGALGGFLSGSGSTIACLTQEDPQAVAQAMQTAVGQAASRTIITRADNLGARVVSTRSA